MGSIPTAVRADVPRFKLPEIISLAGVDPGMDVGNYRFVLDIPPVDLVLRAWFNPNLEEPWFRALMEIVNNVTMLSIVLTGAALVREREHGTIEHLLVMPVTPSEIMLAKVWSMAPSRRANLPHEAKNGVNSPFSAAGCSA